MQRHSGHKVIVCHLGGFQWEDAVKLDAHFDHFKVQLFVRTPNCEN